MRALNIFIFSLILSTGYTQKEGGKLSLKADFGLYVGHTAVYTPNLKIGTDFFTKENNITLFITYSYVEQLLYKGHYIGVALEKYFLNDERRFRPCFKASFMSEVLSNRKEGFLRDASFATSDSHTSYKVYHGKSTYYTFNSSSFYYSTPFFGTASLGFDVRLIKDLHLSFSLGYGLQIMRYKYLEWKNDADYRELLKSSPMKSRKLHYVNAELGLRYEFSFKKESKPQ